MSETTLVNEGETSQVAETPQTTESAAETTQVEQATETTIEQPEGAPEQYEAFQAPEGVTYDEKVISAFSDAAKSLNLPQAKAQEFLDKVAPAMAERQQEILTTMREQWATDSKADKEFGGVKFDENMAFIRTAREQFATPELRDVLDKTGFGNHPEILRFFYRAGKAISQDNKVVTSGNGEPVVRRAESVLYDKS